MNQGEKLTKIAGLERAIAERYGEEAIRNPRSDWDDEKEKKFRQQLKERNEQTRRRESKKEKIDANGVEVSKNIDLRKVNRTCEKCNVYSFNHLDDIYLMKHQHCFKCYVLHIADRFPI